MARLCEEFGLRALVIGTPTVDFARSDRITFRDELPWHEMLDHVASARFLFAPNVEDASPRLLAEALCLDVPLVVNRAILGGWKYVNRFTGVFFDGPDDVSSAVRTCIGRRLQPRAWFRANHGPYNAGRRMRRVLASIDSSLSRTSHVGLAESAA